MGALLADLSATPTPTAAGPDALLRMAAADIGRGDCDYLSTPLGWLGIQRFSDEAFLIRAGNHFLAFHGYAAWRNETPARYRQSPPSPKRVLDCLAEHGTATFGWLNAEFAAVYIDGDRRRACAACHFSGRKLLHWRREGTRLLFASAPRQVHAGGRFRPQLDESVVSAWQPEERVPEGRSFFRDTHRVEAGHALTWSAQGMASWQEARTRVFSFPEVDALLWRAPLHELVEMVRVELDRATERLVLGRAGVVQVSGGLDSSNVVASVLRNARRRGVESPQTVSLTFSGLACDEERQVRILDEALAANVHFERYDARQFAEAAEWVAEHIDYPPMETTHFVVAMCRQMGLSRVCVGNGYGGDEWFTFNPASSLAAPWREWLRHLPDQARWSGLKLRTDWRRRALVPWLRPAMPALAKVAPYWPRARRLLAAAEHAQPEQRSRRYASFSWGFALEQAMSAASIESVSPLQWADLVHLLARIPGLRLCAQGRDKGLLHALAALAISPAFASVSGKVYFDDINSPLLGCGPKGWLPRLRAGQLLAPDH